MPKRGAPVARATIIRKGGPHVRTGSSERAKLHRRMEQAIATALKGYTRKNRFTGATDEAAISIT